MMTGNIQRALSTGSITVNTQKDMLCHTETDLSSGQVRQKNMLDSPSSGL